MRARFSRGSGASAKTSTRRSQRSHSGQSPQLAGPRFRAHRRMGQCRQPLKIAAPSVRQPWHVRIAGSRVSIRRCFWAVFTQVLSARCLAASSSSTVALRTSLREQSEPQ